jgi:hypothetical protein
LLKHDTTDLKQDESGMIGYSVVNASMEEGTLDIFKIDGERWYETRSSENVQAVGTWHSGGEEVLYQQRRGSG